ncbi:DUF5906 domain-containing protein [Pseudaquabacterium pictum]|uniref:NrS-1 polymerase-like helicase domain-containing protein n=1 Tax=Pseudaquabacterium pictum TaxID=2315236 RepID=A0A480AMB4_9BURK|nr:DUF5906 domain-containing protein [Rubrivivax pictus]GCL61507.1 hypothetical protein AQPW35_05880 [Rubrivivax pictus]
MTAPAKPSSAALRAAVLAERADLVQRLQAMPADMADQPQWLLWKLVDKPGAAKPAKVPFYASGKLRGWPHGKPKDGVPTAEQPQVEQGAELDRAHLVPLQQALQVFNSSPAWAGVGFAFLPGDGLIGVDIDGAVDRDTGEMSALCAELLASCASYAETSVSGTGVHIILRGATPKFKSDRIGLEVYCGSQYFTCTGRPVGERLPVADAKPEVLERMRQLVEAANEAEKIERDAAREAARAAARAAAPPAPRRTPAPAPAGGSARDDFRLVNDAALQALARWVPSALPGARAWADGYRVTSKALGRDLQEDLQLLPSGIYDFGEEEAKSPIDVVLQWLPGMAAPKDALHWLARAVGVELAPLATRRAPRPAAAAPSVAPPPPPPPTPAPHGAPPAGPDQPGDVDQAKPGPLGDDPPLPDEAQHGGNVVPLPVQAARPRAHGPGEGATDQAPAGTADDDAGGDGGGDGGGRPGRKIPPETWELVEVMCQRFVLIYSTDTAWDRVELMLVKIAAMRLAFGKTAVNLWLSRPAPVRQMVRPVDLVFEPGVKVPEPQINMFAGLELEPVECTDADVQPMLRLLRHLCSESQTPADDVDAVMHWVLCWQAVPLQRLGTKMQTAIVMHGAQGTGKNLYWDMWRDLFGDYGVTVGQTELEDKFNGWISRKMAILGDEVVSRQEMYHNKNRLKMVVTQQDKFPIRDIQQATRWESNHANVVFLSNESQPLALEERDRRFLVVYTPLEADAALYEAVRDFKRNGGLAKWLYYLQHYPVGDFDAHAKPLMTRAKEDLIEAGWKPAVRFVYEWMEGLLELPVRVCSAEQLYRAFRRWCDLTGAKWPPDQAGFTSEVKRFVNERVRRNAEGKLGQPKLHYKQVALKDAVTLTRKTVRCWLPDGTGPLNGVSEGEWACDAVKTFEADLHRFCRRPGGLDDDAQ